MENVVEVTQSKWNHALNNSLNNASAIITRDYLNCLENYEILKPSAEDVDIDIAECGKFYKLSKLVVNKEENFLNKLTTIVNVASSIDCSIVTIIKSDGERIEYYFGILSKNARDQKEISVRRREADGTAFRGALAGNLIGSEVEELSRGEIERFRKSTFEEQTNCYSSVSGIVALRDEKDRSMEGYVQGIENLVDSLKNQEYTIVMLADPIASSEIQIMKQGYEMLHTQLSTFAKSTVTMNESDTLSLSKARTEGISEGISKGIAMTQSKTKSKGNYFGGSAGIGVNFVVSANVGFNAGHNSSTAYSSGQTDSRMQTSQKSSAVTDTAAASKMTGKSLQLTYENRSVKTLLDKIDKHLERLDECESFGAFDCAAYVIAEKRETALAVASNYNALMRGENSSVQASHINSWFKPEETELLGKYLSSLVHPRFWQNKEEEIIVTPASVISGNELAIQIGLPKKSVPGITVIPMAPFGRNMTESKNDAIVLGKLYHMGHTEDQGGNTQNVKLEIESLSMHTFVTGSTGKGKSTAIYSMLDQLMTHKVKGQSSNIKFMVIEPAKGEYKDRFGSYDKVHVYGTNYKKMPLLRINPFSFPKDIHVLEHIDRLIEIFNVCWPLYAAMPAVLKDSIEKAYEVSGWNLETSRCRYMDSKGTPMYPSFLDVLRQVNVVMNESAYSADSKGDYKGALCTRLKSLTNGLYGQIFTNDELDGAELFDENVIIDLSRTGSGETKALIMGLLVMKLQEYRMAEAEGGNAPLKHITVLEEAHHILKRTSAGQSGEGADLLGKSVEMLANSIAEMRTYGEGFIIADQAPGLLDRSVIRNTNTKIILGLPDFEDRELVGSSANLNEDQILELSRLKTFVAAVYQNNWLEPVLCRIDTNFKKIPCYSYRSSEKTETDKKKVLEYLLLPVDKRAVLDNKYITELTDTIYKLPVSSESKISFIRYTKAQTKEEVQKLRGQVVYELFNSDLAFRLAGGKENDMGLWYECFKEMLDPSITSLDELTQQKIIALLTKEKAQMDGTAESVDLFERLMEHI